MSVLNPKQVRASILTSIITPLIATPNVLAPYYDPVTGLVAATLPSVQDHALTKIVEIISDISFGAEDSQMASNTRVREIYSIAIEEFAVQTALFTAIGSALTTALATLP